MTKALFPGQVTVETSEDPEYPGDVSAVFQVEATGTIDEILALECQWITQVSKCAPGSMLRLSIARHDAK